jgi:hypothetical protein
LQRSISGNATYRSLAALAGAIPKRFFVQQRVKAVTGHFPVADFATIKQSAVATKLAPVPDDHVLIGTWITDGEDSNAAFTVSLRGGKLRVSGFCRSDGEQFEVKQAKWDGKALSFIARMPSTDTITKNVFRVRPDGKVDLELTTYEVWKKKDVKPGELPEAWRVSRRPTPNTKIRRAPKYHKG